MRFSHASVALALTAFAAAAFVASCADDEECTLSCPSGFVCGFQADGSEGCFESCGGVACEVGETCQDGVCTGGGTVTCGSGEHAVAGQCVPNYTASNVCDPLRSCRRSCGTSVSCQDACEADQSDTCSTCLDDRIACETANDCSADGYGDCCVDEFCDCFPSHPACGNVPPCEECATECGDDAGCFSSCAEDEPACAECLQPFFDCREGGGTCEQELIDCTGDL